MTDKPQTTGILTDRYLIRVTHVEGGDSTHGWFATEQEAEDFAMRNRVKLGLNGCLSWHVEHGDA